MKNLICNPLNLEYRYQIKKPSAGNAVCTASLNLSTLNKGQRYYAAVDSFNENGVSAGNIIHLIDR